MSIPQKPKAPMNAVFQFINDNRDSFKKQNPDKKLTEVT